MTDIILHMPAPRNPSQQAPNHPFTPQACRLCSHPTVYRSSSGWSDHATIHHVCWYSSLGDRFVKIPAEELLAQHQKVRNRQVPTSCRPRRVSLNGTPERASSVSPPAKCDSWVRNPEAAVTRVPAPATPSLAAPLQNTWLHTALRKGACVVQTTFVPPWITPLSPVPKEDQKDATKMEEA